jgi:hypothetical protein
MVRPLGRGAAKPAAHRIPCELQRSRASSPQPTAADIKRKNANFAARAQAGKRTTRPSRSLQRRGATKWVIGAMLFLAVGGSELNAAATSDSSDRRDHPPDRVRNLVSAVTRRRRGEAELHDPTRDEVYSWGDEYADADADRRDRRSRTDRYV